MATEAKEAKPRSISMGKITEELANKVGMPKIKAKEVFKILNEIISREMGKDGPGMFTLPGLVKFIKVHKPAVKGGEEKPNRFKPGEMVVTKDKPAHNVVKVRALKSLKSMVA